MKRLRGAQAQAEIGRLIEVIEKLAYVPRRVAIIAAPKLTDLLRQQFDQGVDPYGKPWAPLAPSTIAKGRNPPPLTDTERLRDGTKATPVAGGRAGIRLKIGAPYGYFHQVGFRVRGKRVPKRPVFPNRGMPAAWRRVLEDASRQAAREVR